MWALEVETWSEAESVPTPDFLREVTAVDSNPLLQPLTSQSPSVSHNNESKNEERGAKRPCLRPSANPVETPHGLAKAKVVQKGKRKVMTDFFQPKVLTTDQCYALKESPLGKDDMYADGTPESPEHQNDAEQGIGEASELPSPLAFTQQAQAGHC